jgi:hypothetical protein
VQVAREQARIIPWPEVAVSKRIVPSVLSAVALLAGTASAQAPTRVWKVGGAGGLADVQSAVDLASDGDLILIRTGTCLVQALFVAPNGSAQLGNATAIARVDVAVPRD